MLTAKVILVIVISAALCGLLTGLEIPMLKKLKAGQNIREEGPSAHLKKAGTPTMGGLSIVLTLIVCGVAASLVNRTNIHSVVCVLAPTIAFAGIGFYDDILKILKHENEGLKSGQKLLLQIIIGLGFSVYRYYLGLTNVIIPFIKKPVNFGYWIIPFSVFVFVAMTNAVNLTDGLDGLCSSVTMNVSAFFGYFCLAGFLYKVDNGVTIGFGGNEGSALVAFSLCGACAGFLIFNRHPAKIFMGDTGSLALGACLSGIAMTSTYDFALPIVGLVYVCEALSVIIQVFVFKTQNGRRFFRMAPIHHHFELGGWSEEKVDTVFSAVTLVMGIIAIIVL